MKISKIFLFLLFRFFNFQTDSNNVKKYINYDVYFKHVNAFLWVGNC